MTFAAIRIRGKINVKPDIKKTLSLLNLTRANHCVLLEEKPTTKGMLQVTKDYITWGEINQKVLSKLINERGKIEGDKKLTEDFIKSATSYNNFEKLSEAIVEKKIRFNDIPGVKPVFRLNPPKKGFEGVKRSFSKKGALGYRGDKINQLIERMI